MPPKRRCATPVGGARSSTPGCSQRARSAGPSRSGSEGPSMRTRRPKAGGVPESAVPVPMERGRDTHGQLIYSHSPPRMQGSKRSTSRPTYMPPASPRVSREAPESTTPTRPPVLGRSTYSSISHRLPVSPDEEERRSTLASRIYRHQHAPLRSYTPTSTPRGSPRTPRSLQMSRFEEHAEPEITYSFFLNSKAGTVFSEIARLLSKLPFWKDASMSGKNEVAAARALHGQLQTVDLLLEDRYVSDRIIQNWHRHQKGKRALSDEGRKLINSYNGTKCLTLKAAMVKTFRQGLIHPWEVTPQTFLLNAQRFGVDERRDFVNSFHSMKGYCHNIWIAKPSHRNKGIGIKVFDSVQTTLRYIDNEGAEEDGKATQYVLQKYIERPFLIHGRKFDLRSWCLLTPEFDIYVYDEGVMRTASERFTMANLDDELSHLTNHCIQETGPNFGKFEIGNEMWYGQFQQYLDQLKRPQPGYGWSLREDLLPQVNSIIVESLLASKKKLSHSCTSGSSTMGCFQLFGFDFMVDEDKKVWLIEINGSPASAEYLLEGMMTDLITTIIEPSFPAPPGHAYDSSRPNKFKCVYKNPRPTIDRTNQRPLVPSCSAKEGKRHLLRNRSKPFGSQAAEELHHFSRRL
eukprot:TRINITY_DN8325_c0_g1_i1.p1 TRINITY_DN8325_c0_g1~~TRINITY_DN8325_c0_g1_i1.p1  ORF type:complete len:639 (+),score=152.28 TRINITY_DN8325_c0_g1_i1:27-1919(+)